jgi:hypothetical protein
MQLQIDYNYFTCAKLVNFGENHWYHDNLTSAYSIKKFEVNGYHIIHEKE